MDSRARNLVASAAHEDVFLGRRACPHKNDANLDNRVALLCNREVARYGIALNIPNGEQEGCTGDGALCGSHLVPLAVNLIFALRIFVYRDPAARLNIALVEEAEHRVQIGVVDFQRIPLCCKTESRLGSLIPQHNLLHLLPRRLRLDLNLDKRKCLTACVAVEELLLTEDHLHLVSGNLSPAECLRELLLEISLRQLVGEAEIEVGLEAIDIGTNWLSFRCHTKEVNDETLLVKVSRYDGLLLVSMLILIVCRLSVTLICDDLLVTRLVLEFFVLCKCVQNMKCKHGYIVWRNLYTQFYLVATCVTGFSRRATLLRDTKNTLCGFL